MAKNFKLVPNRSAVRAFMKGNEINDALENLAEDLIGNDPRYDIQAPWDARKSRRVVNIRDLNDDAIGNEIRTGKLSSLTSKRVQS